MDIFLLPLQVPFENDIFHCPVAKHFICLMYDESLKRYPLAQLMFTTVLYIAFIFVSYMRFLTFVRAGQLTAEKLYN